MGGIRGEGMKSADWEENGDARNQAGVVANSRLSFIVISVAL
jgi:hypothetical protein